MVRTLYELYQQRCYEGGAINEHLPILFTLSLMSNGVAEFGVDRGVSTSALLAGQERRRIKGQPASYCGFDINPGCIAEVERLKRIMQAPVDATAYKLSTILGPPIPPVDLLLIDSEHTESHIRKELALHAASVRRFIVLHDTVAFGENGEKSGTRGILYGIEALLAAPWVMIYDSPRNNGLAVFHRGNL